MNKIIKLTNEYASNLNCLCFNFNDNLNSYYHVLNTMFNSCLKSDDIDISKSKYFKIIDIVFISINNNSKFKSMKELNYFIYSLRKDKELLSVYIIKDNIEKEELLDRLEECYSIDGLLPVPFEKNRIYGFLYRILKRIIVEKEINTYMEGLENQLFTPITKIIEEKPKNQIIQVNKRSEGREKDIRFTQTEKISAVEFINSLDDTIIDKVENLEVELDALVGIIYKVEKANASDSVTIVRDNIVPIIENVFILVESIGSFAVAARAFAALNIFLLTLSENEFNNKVAKDLFITMFLAIVSDLEKWLKIIFIDKSTEDIHYLDASFSSNILEIEKIFIEYSDDNDNDDLEFF